MGYNVSKPPFNLTEFLSQKATKRPTKRRFASFTRLGSQAVTDKPEDDRPQTPEGPLTDKT
ncbi:hypothetical protein LHP98_06890 [Rhodobacter sp. Har01]|uniref:hypothetical protein n=1 Tax=Rhodobacter sp. Har01 TaxID=2883999 RepID=UPI001D091818|nr:hypothetical protein [Rhodobacter sp. Har01]MCB6177857.1 hypothetical protein [Rhodobacter sp. Har01]